MMFVVQAEMETGQQRADPGHGQRAGIMVIGECGCSCIVPVGQPGTEDEQLQRAKDGREAPEQGHIQRIGC